VRQLTIVVSMYTLDAIKPYYAHPTAWSNVSSEPRGSYRGGSNRVFSDQLHALTGVKLNTRERRDALFRSPRRNAERTSSNL
jgi:hypothetical protein